MTANYASLLEPLLKVAMVSMRVIPLWMFFPIFSQSTIPANVRLAGGLTLSLALLPVATPALPNWTLEHLPTMAALLGFVIRELVIGAGMGLIARWIFSSCLASSHWLGSQMGFSMASVMNPDFMGSDSSWSEFNHWLFVMIFLSMNGHYLMIQALAESYRFSFTDLFVRLGDAKLSAQLWSEVGTTFFVWMLKLAGPLVAVLLILQAALGVLSKFIPQINMWSVSAPILIFTGVIVFALLIPLYGDALKELANVDIEHHYIWLKYLGAR